MAVMRLDRLLSEMGIASRSEGKALIRAGRVALNGERCQKPEQKVDPETDSLTLDGQPLRYRRFHYYRMDKPVGVVTATEDRDQKTVLDLLPPELKGLGLFPVGRLDKDTSGLLLLTDDGEFAHRVISPKFSVEKRYYARVEGEVDAEDIAAFAAGVTLRDGTRCLPARLENLGPGECLVTVTEGKYHQVKRMLASRGKPVTALRRLSIGAITLEPGQQPGEVRKLPEEDLCKLFRTQYQEN